MIKPFADFETLMNTEQTEKLPKGAYILRIMKTELVQGDGLTSDRIVLYFDIAEGQYMNFFKKQYDSNTFDNKKWRGKYVLWLPDNSSSEMNMRNKRRFTAVIKAFQRSNAGYKWNWDETTLSGKLIGGIFRTEHNEFDGKEVSYTAIAWLTDVTTVRSGNYTLPEDKDVRKPTHEGFVTVDVPDEIPFEFN